MSETALVDRITSVRDRIAAAAARAGRAAEDVDILAVSKRHGVDTMRVAIAAGIEHVGESFAQEMVAKYDELGGADVVWHFVGRLQRNKAKLVVGRADVIHAVDRIALAAEIDRRASAAGVTQAILVAVNTAGEASKGGVAPDEVGALVEEIARLEAVELRGFMTMPPLVDDPEQNRGYFAALRELRARLATAARPLGTLSMGTSGDFEIAVEEGATLVRVGTAIFGARPV